LAPTHKPGVVDSNYGQQFKSQILRTTPPNTPEGVERYLGSGLIKGIGPKFAARLVKAFGVDVFDVIQKAPEKLREVPGIGPTRQERITKAWDEQRAVREIKVFLHSHGVGTSRRSASTRPTARAPSRKFRPTRMPWPRTFGASASRPQTRLPRSWVSTSSRISGLGPVSSTCSRRSPRTATAPLRVMA